MGKGRYRLKRPHYLAGIYRDTEELWFEVLDYIATNYDLDCLECIFLCGDGDGWIRKGLTILPNSVFVLDLFHLDKYLVAALGRDTDSHREIWAALRAGNWPKVKALLKEAEREATTPAQQKKKVRECRRYIRRNWDGILAYRLYPEAHLGVSAEGHVSHILAARISSRPMAWSAKGADRMAQLRAMKANRVSLRERYIAQCREERKPFTICQAAVAQERHRLRKVVGEVFDNLPALQGPVTQLTKALKALSQNSSLVW